MPPKTPWLFLGEVMLPNIALLLPRHTSLNSERDVLPAFQHHTGRIPEGYPSVNRPPLTG